MRYPFPNSFTGAAALVRHLHAQGVPLAVATGSARGAFLIKISKYPDLFSCFHHTVCSDDKEVVHGKPSPDIYFTTVGRFEPPPKSNANVSCCVCVSSSPLLVSSNHQ